ncbi:MAG: nitroreductase family protein [Clostridia bacterium]
MGSVEKYMIDIISKRRSIRKFKSNEIPQDMIEEILNAGILAPSSKNRQPWKYIVVSGKEKNTMILAMQKGIKREHEYPVMPNCNQWISGAEYSLNVMSQAPVTIFIVNTLGLDLFSPLTAEERIFEICNIQSIGASIQNMGLTATALGLGSLWICDIYFAYNELKTWLNIDGELCAALSIGYADEAPHSRPRNNLNDIVEWRK